MGVRFLTLHTHTTQPRVGQILEEHETEMSIFGPILGQNRNVGECFSQTNVEIDHSNTASADTLESTLVCGAQLVSINVHFVAFCQEKHKTLTFSRLFSS